MKKYFFTGLVILLPVALTLMIMIFLFDFFTTPFMPIVAALLKSIQSHLSFTLPEGLNAFIARLFALIFLSAFVLLLGFIAQWFLIRNLIQGASSLFSRIPLLKTVYKISRDVFTALFAQGDKKAFKRPVMIPFPSPPNHCLGFISGEVPKECQKQSTSPLVTVFAPTAPHPISGFLFFVSEKDVHEIDMTNEDAIKFLVSCGVIRPEDANGP